MIKEIIIKTGDKEIRITDKVTTINDLEGFPLVKIMNNEIKVKKEMKTLRL